MLSVVLALSAALLNTMNDLVYRASSMFAVKKKVYSFYFFSSLFAAIFSLIIIFTKERVIRFSSIDFQYGVILGVLSFITYFLFLMSFSSSNTSISATIYRLNMIPGIILAVIFLGEDISLRRGIAIVVCLISIILFVGHNDAGTNYNKYFLFSLGACAVGGILNFMNKVAVQHGGSPLSLLFWRFSTVAILAVILLIIEKGVCFDKDIIKYSSISGFLLLMAIFFVLEALKKGDLSLVLPITQLSFALIAIISWVVLKEKTSLKKIFGVILAVSTILLIN